MRWRDRISIIIVLVLFGGAGFLWLGKERVAATKDELLVRSILSAQMTKMASNLSLLNWAAKYPAAGNRELAACLEPKSVCRVTSPDEQTGFVMPTSLNPRDLHYSGSSDKPAKFPKAQTTPCPDCSGWNVVTTFWAECPESLPACAQAKAINVRVLVRPDPESDWDDAPSAIPPLAEYEAHRERFAMRINLSRNM